jgi:hypothetical protein
MRIAFPIRRAAAVLALGLLGAVACEPPGTPPPNPGSFSLVACPTTTTLRTQELIGLGGGLVDLAGTTIAIPDGALRLPTLITLTIPASEFMEIDVRANNLTSFLFREPIAVRLDYSRCTDPTLATRPVTVWEIDPQTKRLIEFKGGVDDKASRSITFTTEHLSVYAIAF